MRAMILAAGRGQRMGSLTEHTPKPLLRVGKYLLIEHSIFALKRAGITEIIINVSYLKEQIVDTLGDGKHYGIAIRYSQETERLETGGGIVKALPLLKNEPFIVMGSDIITDYPLAKLMLPVNKFAHIILVKNPYYNTKGDFDLDENNVVYYAEHNPFTYASLGIFHPQLFKSHEAIYLKLAELWQPAMRLGKITGECYEGVWYNVGTQQELQVVESIMR